MQSSSKGQPSAEDFDEPPRNQRVYENIPLAFYYDTDIDNRPKMEEEVLLFIQLSVDKVDLDRLDSVMTIPCSATISLRPTISSRRFCPTDVKLKCCPQNTSGMKSGGMRKSL